MLKSMKANNLLISLVPLVVSLMPASAVIVSVGHGDLPGCDILLVPNIVDELGDAVPFPVGEKILHFSSSVNLHVCDDIVNNPSVPDALVTIINLETIDFTEVWYVINQTGRFANADGTVNGSLAMRIDSVGVNRPLILESMTADGIFEAGEAWQFVLEDYVNVPAADAFTTPGVVGGADLRPSIIGTVIPEPSGMVLGLLGGLAFLRRRR
jgi:MYXO-CTERM domain-containing protein